uniref:Putative ovule protein n=1 Tax=Solanum chacoense TaxID=4108 RepID=A0A0V0GL79_SOLCH
MGCCQISIFHHNRLSKYLGLSCSSSLLQLISFSHCNMVSFNLTMQAAAASQHSISSYIFRTQSLKS